MLIFRLIRESYLFAVQSLMANKLQTTLSLLGITIGIFSVITVFTLIDSLEYKIKSSINNLGNEIIYVQKWPWVFGKFPWWKYYQRPEPSLKDVKVLKRKVKGIHSVVFISGVNRSIQYDNQRIESSTILGCSYEYDEVFSFDISDGRYFSANESTGGKSVAIIGADIAEALFKQGDPVGKKIKIFGKKLQVIGVFKKEGESMFSQSHDNRVLVPINFARNVINLKSGRVNPAIAIIPEDGMSKDLLKDNIRLALRAAHRLKPTQDDDFSMNEISTISSGFDGIFKTIGLAGWFIGGLSLLVGGFGIANIMFVTVRERTNQIGIQKALGAKNFFVLFQFLFESVFLSLFGGFVGIIIVSIGVMIARFGFDFELIMSFSNIILGILVSLFIGLAAGLIPAYLASKMSPVEAMRSV